VIRGVIGRTVEQSEDNMVLLTSLPGDRADAADRNRFWIRALPFLVLLSSALFLYLSWERIPDSWIIHWGIDGKPDGWATKNAFWVFFPIGLGLLICLMMEAIASSRLTGASKENVKISPQAAAHITALTRDFIRVVELATAIALAAIAIMLPLAAPVSPFPFIVMVAGLVFLGVILGMYRMFRGARELRRSGMLEGLEGWNGIYYSNPEDPRIWVEKFTGYGYTLNFAHRQSWLVLALILAFPLTIIVVIALAL
jgi:uncharacterized membrane protein